MKNEKIEIQLEIFKNNVYRQKSEMDNFTEEIMLALEKTPPKTLREATVIIEKTDVS